MQYLLLIYSNEADGQTMTDAERGAFMDDYRTFTQRIVASGEFKAGDALHPVATATSVRVRDGQTLLTDGPFAETREQLGGYYLVDAENLDRAVEIASQIPSAKHGTIEVRPIMVWDTQA
ncbi:MAG: YciI family protein [Alphaproteobacteria bacterium]|nr:YciI family protein [Alphaproteobacteria bacterium]